MGVRTKPRLEAMPLNELIADNAIRERLAQLHCGYCAGAASWSRAEVDNQPPGHGDRHASIIPAQFHSDWNYASRPAKIPRGRMCSSERFKPPYDWNSEPFREIATSGVRYG
jgi:hypothetical protein